MATLFRTIETSTHNDEGELTMATSRAAKAPKIQTLPVESIGRCTENTQVRQKTDAATVERYHAVLQAREEAGDGEFPFPPLVVFKEEGKDTLHLADGFHRLQAAIKAGWTLVPCHVHNGTAHDAKIAGIHANANHGLPLSAADRTLCVAYLRQTTNMTIVEIARVLGVSTRTVDRALQSTKNTPTHTSTSTTDTVASSAVSVSDEEEADEDDDASGDRGATVGTAAAPPPPSPAHRDTTGNIVPEKLLPAFTGATGLVKAGTQVDAIRTLAKQLHETPAGAWLGMQEIDATVRTLKRLLTKAAFYAVCPQCEGEGCLHCEQLGWIPAWMKE